MPISWESEMYKVPDQNGRRIIVTGANSGIGKESAKRLAGAGAEVVLAVRSPAKGEAARQEILSEVPGAALEVRALDLADLASVRAFAEQVITEGKPLHVLVNNAGVMSPPKRETTVDGFELQFGSNFLGPFLLTNLLLPLLLTADRPRVATMSSVVADSGAINWDDPNWQRGYAPMKAYGQSKLADMLMGLHLGELAQSRGWKLLSTLAHPGFARTNLQSSGPNMGTGRESTPFYQKLIPSMDASGGAEPLLHAIADPGARQSIYYGPRWYLVGETHHAKIPKSATRSDPARLWSLAETLTGVTAPA